MNGPQHYREAERDIDRANNESIADGFAQFLIARAQVHATLALAAATMDAVVIEGEQANAEQWRELTSS